MFIIKRKAKYCFQIFLVFQISFFLFLMMCTTVNLYYVLCEKNSEV